MVPAILRRLGCVTWILVTVLLNDNLALSLDSDDRVRFVTPATFYGQSDNMTSEKNCCVPFCGSQQQPLHKFPNPDKDPDRFRTWIYNIGGDILSLQNAIIFKRRRVCHLHFESKYHTRSKLLSPNAVPTLNLSGSRKRRLPLADISNPIVASSSKEADTISSPSTVEDVPPLQQVKASDEVKICKHTMNVVKGSRKPVKCEKLLSAEILKLRKENDSFRRRLEKAKSLSTNSAFQIALKKFKTLAAIFTVMQFREISKSKLGRRFTKEEKCMALSMYKMGPKAYRWLSNVFVLPSPVTLSRMIS